MLAHRSILVLCLCVSNRKATNRQDPQKGCGYIRGPLHTALKPPHQHQPVLTCQVSGELPELPAVGATALFEGLGHHTQALCTQGCQRSHAPLTGLTDCCTVVLRGSLPATHTHTLYMLGGVGAVLTGLLGLHTAHAGLTALAWDISKHAITAAAKNTGVPADTQELAAQLQLSHGVHHAG